MSFKINPCKAVMQKVKDSNCDINKINDLCYDISNAYGNVYGSELKNKLDKQCADLVTEKKCVLGKTTCNLKRPVPPPHFNQIPHFFPALLKESNNPQQSYKKCCKMSKNTTYPNSCAELCKLDFDAVETQGSLREQEKYNNMKKKKYNNVNETYDNNMKETCNNSMKETYDKHMKETYDNNMKETYDNNMKETYDNNMKETYDKHKKIDYKGYKDAHPVLFFIGFAVVTTLMVILVWCFIRSLMIKKIN